MKRNLMIISGAIGLIALMVSSCGPLVTSGPDVVVGGGIYPPPVLNPPMGNPNMFRPGGPFGPGFAPGGYPGRYPGNNVGFIPGNPGTPVNPGNQGRPGINNQGNNRQPGTGIGGGNPGGGILPPNNGGGPGGAPGGPGGRQEDQIFEKIKIFLKIFGE